MPVILADTGAAGGVSLATLDTLITGIKSAIAWIFSLFARIVSTISTNDLLLYPVFAATQAYDGLDLNVKRAADEVWYLTQFFWHFTHIESSHTTLCKVADKQTEVQGRMFKKGMRKVAWDVCEVPLKNFLFWRKSYYGSFISNFVFGEKPKPQLESWNDTPVFKSL